MKKLLMTIILVAATIFLFTGCSNKNDISACDEKRKEIEEKYGITICYGDDNIDDEEISNIDLCDEEADINKIMEDIDDFFSKLPIGFVEELTSMNDDDKTKLHVVISDGKYSGVSFAVKETEYWVINDSETIMTLAEDMMYSIIYHIRYSGGVVNFMPEWKSYNPEGFVYGENDSKYLYGNSDNKECYFLIEEATESVIYEMQILFSMLWDEMSMSIFNMNEFPKVEAKLQYLCSELDRIFETVDENAYWARYIK